MSYRAIAVGLVSLLAFSVTPAQEKPKQQVMPELAQSLQSAVQRFLQGDSTPAIITYVTDGEFNETVPNAQDLKKTYGDCAFVFFKVSLSADMHTAIMTLKTDTRGTVRWHTFVLMAGDKPETKWEIKNWHSSHV